MEQVNAGFDTIVGIGYAFTKDVASMTELQDGTIAVVFSGSNAWNNLYFTPGTASFSEQSEKDRPGILIRQQFSALTVKDLPNDWILIDELMRRRVILRLEYRSGVQIVGQLPIGVEITVQMDNQNGRGVKFSFDRKTVKRSRWEFSGSGSGA